MGYTTPDEWDAHYAGGNTFRDLGDTERRLLAEHTPPPQDGLALDIGCGLGALARHLAHLGYQVDAVDYAPSSLTLAEAQDPSAAVTYRLFDIERDSLDSLPHAAYDLITFRLSWAFIRDRTRVMNRVRERLRPGGALCVITPVADAVPKDKRDIALDEDELELLCVRTGRLRTDTTRTVLPSSFSSTPPPPRLRWPAPRPGGPAHTPSAVSASSSPTP
ncbi:class I SAM-dependent methyltransferase [Streptomyces sp. NPDC001156]